MCSSRIFLSKVYQARPRVFKVVEHLDCFLKALFLSALLCLGSLAVALPQSPEPELPKKFRSELLKARYDKTAQFKLQAGSWDKAVATQFKMFVQTTVPLNDKIANALIKKTEAKEFLARAIYNDTSLLIKLEWADSSQSLFSRKELNSYGDSVALEIPKEFSARLPYIGMGDEQKNVYVYMQRAAEEGILANEYIAAGFGSLTRLNKTISKMQMNYDTKTNKWQAIFSLPLALRNMRQFVVPVAFAFWDGAKNQRGGNKYLSAWQFIELATFKKNPTYLQQISFAYNELPSPQKGQQIFNSVCVACHRAGTIGNAPEHLAPNLENIGALASTAYLRDSLLEPSQIVVRQLNINRHYNKSMAADANRAYPNNEVYKWYNINEKGERISKMPSFKNMADADINSLVAYLQTLR